MAIDVHHWWSWK